MKTEIKEAEQEGGRALSCGDRGSKVRRLLGWSSYGGRLLGAMVRSGGGGFLRIVRDTRMGRVTLSQRARMLQIWSLLDWIMDHV